MRSRMVLLGGFAAMALAVSASGAAAMPNGLAAVGAGAGAGPVSQQVRWVCNPWGRCWWRPNYYHSYGFVAPPRFYGPRPWGWRHRHWRHW